MQYLHFLFYENVIMGAFSGGGTVGHGPSQKKIKFFSKGKLVKYPT